MPDKVTIKPRSNHRVGVFVDMQNLYHSAKHLHNARINFAELLKLAVADRQIVRALVYVVKSGETEEQPFFEALEKSGLELKMKDLQVFAGGAKKADWDVGMAVDVISMAKQLDVAVLVTGDGDFVPLVEYLRHNGLIVEAVSFGRSTSLKLKEAVNNYYDLDEHKKVLMRIPGSRSRTGTPTPRKPVRTEKPEATLTGFMPPRIRHDEE
ncbi:MAG: NYN domain-containing protein [Candidatus Yanofskybacteria bacterium]|nr:NYN domain-containing protein [Candidatus Yanofskybacteria bacterium]